MKSTQKLILTIAIAVSASLLLVGCGEEVTSKNMEQLYAEQGVPVKTETVEVSTFSQGLEYNAVLTGIKESSAFSSISAEIEKINYTVGDYVAKDAVVLTFPTDNPKAQYFQSKLAYENAAVTFERMKAFYETGGLSSQDFDNAETSFRVAEANWDMAAQSVEVRAPIAGLLTRINVRETENVDKEVELFTIAEVDRVKARVWASDSDIGGIKIGQNVIATWNDNEIQGKVVQVDLSMNQAKKAFAVDAVFDNTQSTIRTGITAEIMIETYRSESAIYIERKNVITEDTYQYVFVNQAGVAKKQEVQVGLSSGTDVEITEGLRPGDELVIEGQMLLADNDKLNVVTN